MAEGPLLDDRARSVRGVLVRGAAGRAAGRRAGLRAGPPASALVRMGLVGGCRVRHDVLFHCRSPQPAPHPGAPRRMGILNWIVLGVLLVCVIVLSLYAIRHYLLMVRRLTAARPRDPMELTGFVLPSISVLVPMHNEEQVAADILTAIIEADYDRRALEVIVIDDRSTDGTAAILDRFASEYPFVRVLHRTEGPGGKPRALEYGTAQA